MLLIVVLLTTLLVTGPLGLSSSLKESKYKYNLAHWFEEIARSLGTFKLASYSNIPQEKTDYYTGNYLFARSKHFKILVTQYISFVIFKTLIKLLNQGDNVQKNFLLVNHPRIYFF